MGLAAMNCPRPQPPIKKDKKSQVEANKTTGSPVRQWSGGWLAPCTQRCSRHYLPPASATPHPSAFVPPPPPNVVYTAGMPVQVLAQFPPLPPVRDHPLPGTRGSLQHRVEPPPMLKSAREDQWNLPASRELSYTHRAGNWKHSFY